MRKLVEKTLGRRSEGQKGFTLIELLIVVGIIVALAAVIIPLVIQFADKGEEGAQANELGVIQSAIDNMMTDLQLETVAPGLVEIYIDALTDFDPGPCVQNLASYVREPTTQWCYTWNDKDAAPDTALDAIIKLASALSEKQLRGMAAGDRPEGIMIEGESRVVD